MPCRRSSWGCTEKKACGCWPGAPRRRYALRQTRTDDSLPCRDVTIRALCRLPSQSTLMTCFAFVATRVSPLSAVGYTENVVDDGRSVVSFEQSSGDRHHRRMNPLELHRDALVIDSHNDSVVAGVFAGDGLGGRPTRYASSGTIAQLRGAFPGRAAKASIQLDLERMRDGGIDAAFFAVCVTKAWNNHAAYALDGFGILIEETTADNRFRIARTADDITAAKRDGAAAAILALEDSDGLERSLNILGAMYELGLRSVGITHNLVSWAAAGQEEPASGGLTIHGIALVRELNRLGILVDVSHLNDTGFWDVIAQTEQPLIASHSNCRMLCSHPRNLDDRQIEAVAATGGLLAITFVPKLVSPIEPSLERLLDHIDHAIKVAGADHVGLGSNFDGGGTVIPHAGEYSSLTTGMAARGYDTQVIRAVLGQNHLRVFRAVCG